MNNTDHANGRDVGELSITVRSATSDYEFDASVPKGMTVQTFKSRASKQLGKALFNQQIERVVLAVRHRQSGVRLQDDRTLGSYEQIADGDTLELYEDSAAGCNQFEGC